MSDTHTNTYYTIRTLVRCLFIIAVALASFIFGKAVAQDPYAYKCTQGAVTIQSGDTLWSLAQKHCTGHIGQATDDLVNKYGTDLQVGDIIAVAGERK